MLTPRAIVAGSALIVLACGCSSGGDKTVPTTTVKPTPSTVPRTVTSRPATTPTSVPGFPLDALILTDAPSEFPRRPDSLAATGPTDLEKAALEDPLNDEAEARRTLRLAGFLRGHQRQWSTGDAIGQNFIFLYQFATPAGAEEYVQHWRTTIIADISGSPPVTFTPTVPGALGFHSRSDRSWSGVVLFAKGVYAVQAVVSGGPGTDPRERASALALAQFALLPEAAP